MGSIFHLSSPVALVAALADRLAMRCGAIAKVVHLLEDGVGDRCQRHRGGQVGRSQLAWRGHRQCGPEQSLESHEQGAELKLG